MLPTELQARFNQAHALHLDGELVQARLLYEEIVGVRPEHLDTLGLLGLLENQAGHHQEALAWFQRAVRLAPRNVALQLDLGNALLALGQLDAAVESYERAIALQPGCAQAYCNRGVALKALNQLQAAVLSYDQAIALRSDYAQAYVNRGNALAALNQWGDALASYNAALECAPDFSEAHCNRGLVLHALGQWEAAVDSCNQAIAINSDFARAFFNRGNAQLALNRWQDAVSSFDRAIAINPEYAEAYCNRGAALTWLGKLEAALASCDRAIALAPNDAAAHCNRGNVLQEFKQLGAAIVSYDNAIQANPHFADAYWNQATALLLGGDFTNGWRRYEWRWMRAAFSSRKRVFPQAQWCGRESLIGKTILLHSEQGLGDTLQFCRYASKVAALGARVLLEVEAPLVGLLQSVEGVDATLVKGAAVPPFDFHCPLLSLPLAFETRLESIPCAPSYLVSNTDIRKEWASKLGAQQKPRIGIVWSGATVHKNDQKRSVALSDFMALLPPGFDYVSLQRDVRDSDLAVLEARDDIRHFGHALTDFAQTAALCDLMDLVISVDTSVAHLSAALGRPTWILLPFCPDWRWLLDRNDSPWYPSVTLFRQTQPNDWNGVFQRVATELNASAEVTTSLSQDAHTKSVAAGVGLVSPSTGSHCPVCAGECSVLDTVDFNKSCEESRGRFFAPSGIPIRYDLCSNCGFCFAPDIAAWTLEQFQERIYNDDYVRVDPDYAEVRPAANAAALRVLLGDAAHSIRHLDFGGGHGLLSQLLRQSHWQSVSYDPLADRHLPLDQLGTFDLITAYEVFEHVPDPQQLVSTLRSLLSDNGIILFSTLLSDGKVRADLSLGWWYAAPRNGHISLFSRTSLAILGKSHGFGVVSFSAGLHAFLTTVPSWAQGWIRAEGLPQARP